MATKGTSGSSVIYTSDDWRWLDKIRLWWRKYVPHLVWEGQEVDVLVKLSLPTTGKVNGVLSAQYSKIDGRYWLWDFSLARPISVTFVRVTENRRK